MMIRPVNFGFNEETAVDNAFQQRADESSEIQATALKEFDAFVEVLRKNDVEVIVVNDTEAPHTPDSIFPNNWITTHADGSVFIYPMFAENRRRERRSDILELLKQKFNISRVNDLTFLEKEAKFLEGTGSMVLDRDNNVAYAGFSIRTSTDGLGEFCKLADFKPVTFTATNQSGKQIYHTNVMMSVGEKFAVVCLDSIRDEEEKKKVVSSLTAAGKEIVQISMEQLQNFAGNMLEIKSRKGENLLVMSERAYKSLSAPQVTQLEKYVKIVYSPLTTIENNGGGSARCMIAEIHLPSK